MKANRDITTAMAELLSKIDLLLLPITASSTPMKVRKPERRS
jgi:hypothetical protein